MHADSQRGLIALHALLLRLRLAPPRRLLARVLRILANAVERTGATSPARTVVTASSPAHDGCLGPAWLFRIRIHTPAASAVPAGALDVGATNKAGLVVDDLVLAFGLEDDQVVPGNIPNAVDWAGVDSLKS